MSKANPAGQNTWGVDITPLVPEVYADYRPLVADALAFFLRHLSTPRLTAILTEQQALPSDAGVAQRLTSLLFHCPTLHKFGQVVARNRKLDRALRSRLQTLETMPGTTYGDAVKQVIRRELGDAEGALRLDSTALAEASVSVVVPFTSVAAESSGPANGVLKVLKPGIEESLQEELAIWSKLGQFIDERCEYYRIPPLNYAESLATIRELLAGEIRLDHEQRHLAEAAEFYKDARSIQIPALFPFCTPRITAMERIYGQKVTDVEVFSARQRRRLANSVIEALIARPVWTPLETAIFHADPHAGNLFFTEDERLAVLDWSLTGYLGKVERIHMMQLLLGALTLDPQRIAREIEALAQTPVNASALGVVVDKAVSKLYAGKFPGFRWSQSLLDEASLAAGVQFSSELLLYRKSILTLEGVIKDISGGSSIGRVLPAAAIRQFVCELTARAFAPPASRHFGTHLSNLDLLALYWGGPTAAARFWTHRWQRRLTALLSGPTEP
ncbi:AarF/ABC1/UbiB kinase family protein [Candidatus Thiosymbion oneisti]|uniref:AarF/ABC1/UbiB kinase family protein n=1 Tax=Candidatus Thiosymbion oneisti TaxID=589554 RepID=UPI000B7E31FF|nr:AarF/ABC1/UbiB kinase family protein [Candidatus Thiosymbion oneisti]